jgi:hypothetical protein
MATNMDAHLTALGISFVAVIIAAFSLGWNIYRDVVLKPRLRVHFQVSTLVTPGQPQIPKRTFLDITSVNHGPGRIVCSMIHARLKTSIWRRLRRKPRQGVIPGDWTNPISGKLPSTLEVGQKLVLLLPYQQDCFLKEADVTKIGVLDTFGRTHWAPRQNLYYAQRQYQKDFPSDPQSSL